MYKLATILLVLSGSLMAQWPKHQDPALPRTPKGTADLSAPVPRSGDGKPDLSGVWVVTNGNFYLTWDLKPEEMLPWAAAVYKQREANFRRDTDGIACLPPGPKAAIGVGPFPIKIIQNPGLVVILHEYDTIFRQVFTDGRALPEDPNPTWMGYSIGRWEGDSLVVTTAGFNDQTTIDLAGHPHTEALRTTERFHRRDVGHLDVQITFDDPKAYTRPWTLPMEFALVPDQDLMEYVCENERDARHLVGTSGDEFQISADALTLYTGAYQSAGRPVANVSLQEGRLLVGEGKSAKVPLVAHSDTYFTMEGTGVEFLKDEKGAVTAMIEHWVEGDRKYLRIDRR